MINIILRWWYCIWVISLLLVIAYISYWTDGAIILDEFDMKNLGDYFFL